MKDEESESERDIRASIQFWERVRARSVSTDLTLTQRNTKRYIPQNLLVRGISALKKEPFGPDLGNGDKSEVRCTNNKKSRKIWKSNCNRHADSDSLQKWVQVAERRLNFTIVSKLSLFNGQFWNSHINRDNQIQDIRRTRRSFYKSLQKCLKAQR